MHAWLIRDLDPLPIGDDDRRLLRSGLLAKALVERGHAVTWFTSSFDHYRKVDRPSLVGEHDLQAGYRLQVLPGRGYRRNVSLARILHNRNFARRLVAASARLCPPDIVLGDIPTTEAGLAAVRLAQEMAVPSIVSIRDLWPDFFLDHVPPLLRPLARPALAVLDRQVKAATHEATALLAVSDGYLAWGQEKGCRSQTALDRVFPLGYAARPDAGVALTHTERARLGIPGSGMLVAFIGSWGRTYDLDLVAETAERLAGRPDIRFVLAGDSAPRPDLARRLSQMANVTLAGWLGTSEIAAVLRASAIGLMPYRAGAPQGLPNKIFEYMAYGAFQLSTLQGEAADFLARERCGETVAPGDAAALAGAIVQRARLPDPSQGRAARISRFEARYSARTVYPSLVDHIELVASQAGG